MTKNGDFDEDRWEDMEPAVWRYMIMSKIQSLEGKGKTLFGVPQDWVIWVLIFAAATGNVPKALEVIAMVLGK